MIRTIVYLVLFILTLIFLFQNGTTPVTLKFLRWQTPTTIPVGFVFVGALLVGGVIVWLYHLPKMIFLKTKLKNLDRKITLLMEDIKRKEREIEELKKKKEELEGKIKEKIEEKPKEEKPLEEKTKEGEEKKEEKKNIFSIFKRKRVDENKEFN
ncbi:MAG: LapA family protein [Caldisericia bacterium]|nr:LapA family protein [Caldisericia bacterium]